MFLSSSSDDIRDIRIRFRYAVIFVSVFFLILLGRLWFLQIIRGDYFFDFSRANTFKLVPIPATRGRIIDTQGEIVADNKPSYLAVLNRQYIQNLEKSLETLSFILDVPLLDLRRSMAKSEGQPRFRPVTVWRNLEPEQLARLEVNKIFLPGIDTQAVPTRFYSAGASTFHLLGYLGEVSKDELGKLNPHFPGLYKQGDWIGKAGIEQLMDPYIKGIDGGEQVAVDAFGRRTDDALIMRDLENQKPIAGNDIVLNIDMRLQRVAESLFAAKGHAGSAIALDPKTGGVLVLYSAPSLDPHMFARGITKPEWAEIQGNIKKPLIDKSLSGQYPPGSTYKFITAVAGLESKMINPNERVFCPGHFQYGNRMYRCWKASGHGSVNLYEALVQSCDVYFYRLGLKLGIDRLYDFASHFGLGRITGIGINNEQSGLVPSREWKLRARREEWQEGETLSVAIGQGFNLVTPLQLASAVSALVNGGKVYRPWLVREVREPSGKVLKRFEPEVTDHVEIHESTRKEVLAGLTGVVQDSRGTAYGTRLPDIIHGGKTGTAQVVRMAENRRVRSEDLAYLHRDHAWFFGFAPDKDPEIVVVVMVEHGGHGSSAAAPIARDIIKKFFENRMAPVTPAVGTEKEG